MGTVQAQAIMSLDGYVAKPDNTIGRLFDWLQNGDVAIPTPAGDFTQGPRLRRMWHYMVSLNLDTPLLRAVVKPSSLERPTSMGKLLVHITSGPEAPTRAALGLLVARAGIDEGHEVSIFLAGDAVQLIRDAVLDSLSGLGTGSLRESFDAIAGGGGRFYISGMSSKARRVTEDDLAGKPAELAMPRRLVQLAFDADRTFTY